MSETVAWLDDGSPHSPRFSDRYRSRSGGLAQAQAVFLAGCGLPERWRGITQFTVLETGFGLGLNFLTTWALWAADAQRCDVLHFVSVEAYPVAAMDIVRSALAPGPFKIAGQPEAQWVEADLLQRLPVLARELSRVWRDPSPGLHRFDFADGRVHLTLAVGEVALMLKCLAAEVGDAGLADAVYLDGFSPALNPDMWSPDTLQAVAQLCHPGTRLASYSVAQSVRQSLNQLGFRVEKCPGLPPKRQRLEAVFLPV